jgi:hypothetical protein
MFFIFQREPCFIFIGKIKVNFNSNPFGYLAAYVRCLQFQSLRVPCGVRTLPTVLMDNKILVSILTHRCQCPHVIKKRGGVRGGATHIHKRKLSSEPHVKKGYKLGNHHFYNPATATDKDHWQSHCRAMKGEVDQLHKKKSIRQRQ